MIKFFAEKTLIFFDYFHKKKIIKFLKKSNIFSINIFLDIGAHKGESIDFFSNNLQIKKIYSFEASLSNFEILKKKYKNNNHIVLENVALSSSISELKFNQCDESSSSTFSSINSESKYLQKKMKYLNASELEIFFKTIKLKTNTLDNYLKNKNISTIDLIRLDTEGHEFQILKGLEKNLKNVKTIIFEHHYDNMLKKNYTFSDINQYLKKNYFKKIFKIKMPFRKSFEYIYINTK